MKKLFFFLLAGGFLTGLQAQENLTYQKPPQEILELVDVPLAPSTLIDSKGETMVFLYRDQYKSIAELSETELRLGGLRINPVTNISSRATYYNNIEVKPIDGDEPTGIKGLPANPRLSNFSWSPDEKKMAFTHTTDKGVELWVADLATSQAKKLTDANLNANMRDVINWYKDNSAILVKMLPQDRKDLIDPQDAVPDGPTISVSDGSKAQNRTYQDLLQNSNDEYNFEQLTRSVLMKVDLNGKCYKMDGPKNVQQHLFFSRWKLCDGKPY
jgi:dipeptidyl aminopeptidase/acylaminoacyl peptidase